jgi:TRAP-type C4-dicarboxylate transport system permease small subunit
MLYLCWLMLRGGWQQTVINYGTTSAVMEASMAWFYSSGVVFAVLAMLIIVHELWKLLSGQLDDRDLIGVTESEDVPHGTPDASAADAQQGR